MNPEEFNALYTDYGYLLELMVKTMRDTNYWVFPTFGDLPKMSHLGFVFKAKNGDVISAKVYNNEITILNCDTHKTLYYSNYDTNSYYYTEKLCKELFTND